MCVLKLVGLIIKSVIAVDWNLQFSLQLLNALWTSCTCVAAPKYLCVMSTRCLSTRSSHRACVLAKYPVFMFIVPSHHAVHWVWKLSILPSKILTWEQNYNNSKGRQQVVLILIAAFFGIDPLNPRLITANVHQSSWTRNIHNKISWLLWWETIPPFPLRIDLPSIILFG